jgi:hypothetical protein
MDGLVSRPAVNGIDQRTAGGYNSISLCLAVLRASVARIAAIIPLTAQAIRNVGRRYWQSGLERVLYERPRSSRGARRQPETTPIAMYVGALTRATHPIEFLSPLGCGKMRTLGRNPCNVRSVTPRQRRRRVFAPPAGLAWKLCRTQSPIRYAKLWKER